MAFAFDIGQRGLIAVDVIPRDKKDVKDVRFS
jgi:hypothetical protein